MSVTSTSSSQGSTGINLPSITGNPVQAGVRLTGSCWIRATSASNLGTRIKLSEGAESTWTTLSDVAGPTAQTGGWVKASVTGTIPTTGGQIILSVYSTNQTSSSGALVYDDCSVVIA